jgi:hypothetical protein
VRSDSLSPATSTDGPLTVSLRSSLTTCSTESSSFRLSGYSNGDTAIADASLEPFKDNSAAASGDKSDDASNDNTGKSKGDSSGHDSTFALLQLFKGQGKASRTPTRSAGSADSSSVAGTTGTEALTAGRLAGSCAGHCIGQCPQLSLSWIVPSLQLACYMLQVPLATAPYFPAQLVQLLVMSLF